ncbi:hypothetical protein JY651_35565 [Pyxidicoccus parkwayensis]|uniref:Uncharacterized protein n=1 Tax=Pyxidicoccus parkwayensis TaxID=2813578 RepID=A0ABX7NQ15_9BACT|nr:hypothetical protein [Pyxidicoccus parkwaysis]QSQ20526.1 hypothetical protein JY651_35565 [Pyxidicoccus parkwaysis]
MDANAVAELEKAGVKVDQPDRLYVAVEWEDGKRVLPVGQRAQVRDGELLAHVTLQPISKLWTGSTVPPSFAKAPPPEYHPFFMLIEATAAGYCRAVRNTETDQEFERLYRHLLRRPDGTDRNPLFSYLQGAARLYMSLRDVSQAEFEAVIDRLQKSAKHFQTHVGSINYFQEVLRGVLGA